MSLIFRILRIIPVAMFCGLFALAALNVSAERSDLEFQGSFIETDQGQLSFLEATFHEMNRIWITSLDVWLANGSYAQVPLEAEQPKLSSLDALKLRTRGINASSPNY